jgi:hypothetical protein
MTRPLSQFFEIGFHGDKYLIDMVFGAARRSRQFVETGCNVGSSLCYLARHFPDLPCSSCEPDDAAFRFAREQAAPMRNAQVFHEASPDFLHAMAARDPQFCQRETIFWLDSHGYGFRWPLREEIEFITSRFSSAFIFIDDFQVPGQPQFLFDEYDGQVCGLDWIAAGFHARQDYRLVYPCYREKTSTHHPLKGWVLITFGSANSLEIPPQLAGKVTAGFRAFP